MKKLILLVSVLTLIGGCSEPERVPTEKLQEIYGRLVLLGKTDVEPDPEELEAIRRVVDSLGGAARVESLLVDDMISHDSRWKSYVDSLGREIR